VKVHLAGVDVGEEVLTNEEDDREREADEDGVYGEGEVGVAGAPL